MKESISRFSQMQEKTQSLTDKSLELGREINAELWAVIKEEEAIAEDFKKPKDQQCPDIQETAK